jgi:hypothetical protein
LNTAETVAVGLGGGIIALIVILAVAAAAASAFAGKRMWEVRSSSIL